MQNGRYHVPTPVLPLPHVTSVAPAGWLACGTPTAVTDRKHHPGTVGASAHKQSKITLRMVACKRLSARFVSRAASAGGVSSLLTMKTSGGGAGLAATAARLVRGTPSAVYAALPRQGRQRYVEEATGGGTAHGFLDMHHGGG